MPTCEAKSNCSDHGVALDLLETAQSSVQYQSEMALELKILGYSIEKTCVDGRPEIAGIRREAIDASSTRRAESEAAMAERGVGESAASLHLAARAALMTRAARGNERRVTDIDRQWGAVHLEDLKGNATPWGPPTGPRRRAGRSA